MSLRLSHGVRRAKMTGTGRTGALWSFKEHSVSDLRLGITRWPLAHRKEDRNMIKMTNMTATDRKSAEWRHIVSYHIFGNLCTILVDQKVLHFSAPCPNESSASSINNAPTTPCRMPRPSSSYSAGASRRPSDDGVTFLQWPYISGRPVSGKHAGWCSGRWSVGRMRNQAAARKQLGPMSTE